MNNASTPNAYLPIREVAKRTGVNPVTLRAWERRYGLIIPHRTPKGHRLYSDEQVNQIKRVLFWLDRGVSISHVKPLIEQADMPMENPEENNQDWTLLCSQMHTAIKTLNENRFVQAWNKAMSLYPVDTVNARLIYPLWQQLRQEWQGSGVNSSVEARFFNHCLKGYLYSRLHHNGRDQNFETVVLASLSDEPEDEISLLLEGAVASSLEYRVMLLYPTLNVTELPLILDRIPAGALLLHSHRRLASKTIEQELPRLRALYPDLPIGFSGDAVLIHQNALDAVGIHTQPESPQQLMRQLLGIGQPLTEAS
ncbi:MerR family transcriptional regulator [Pokkaliibacter sp. CJK22405]|uniref:MerR family transcriptional regulator n=1 Tax=Pokkaliibacter sp. CJK22405 TaxID=3384615 RepID=UPI00398476F3